MENKKVKIGALVATALVACMAIAPCVNADTTKPKKEGRVVTEQSQQSFKNKKIGKFKKKASKEQLENLTDEEKEALKAERKAKKEELKSKFESLSDEEKEALKAEKKAKKEKLKSRFENLTDEEKEALKVEGKAKKGGEKKKNTEKTMIA